MTDRNRQRDYLLRTFSMRKNSPQKAAFRRWLLEELQNSGWTAAEERYGGLNPSVNVVAGNADAAQVVVVAHYDTTAKRLLPCIIFPVNRLMQMIFRFSISVLTLVISYLFAFGVGYFSHRQGLILPVFLLLATVLLFFEDFGPANRQNANGNSSGVLTLLELLRQQTPRDSVCFVFLDNGAKDALGAEGYRKRYGKKQLVINLDCVGDGEQVIVMPSPRCKTEDHLLRSLQKAFSPSDGMQVHLMKDGHLRYRSDHVGFPRHVAICTCRKTKLLGYYIPNLHSSLDRELSDRNVSYMVKTLSRFLNTYR